VGASSCSLTVRCDLLPMSSPSDRAAAKTLQQVGALPFRRVPTGVQVLLVTSRGTKRWVIPKGNPIKGLKAHKAAAQEAFEEAGVKGRPKKEKAGSYSYWKRLQTTFALCEVDVFPLVVEEVKDEWPEKGQRERRWFDPQVAANMVDEPGLETVLRAFANNAPVRTI
jgi:8-oxo-dGTP pyrophosphatase MutT (NUDIX family)